jgi:hypothetical protein
MDIAGSMRAHGVRLLVSKKNVGRLKYSFNAVQVLYNSLSVPIVIAISVLLCSPHTHTILITAEGAAP